MVTSAISSSHVILTRSRLIVGYQEYYWLRIVSVELQNNQLSATVKMLLLLALLALLAWAFAVDIYQWLLFVLLATFPVLGLFKRVTKPYEIIIHYRDKDNGVRKLRPLASLQLTNQEIEQYYVNIRQAHMRHG
ncbi:hypothetical protein [Rhodoflexus sp.]